MIRPPKLPCRFSGWGETCVICDVFLRRLLGRVLMGSVPPTSPPIILENPTYQPVCVSEGLLHMDDLISTYYQLGLRDILIKLSQD